MGRKVHLDLTNKLVPLTIAAAYEYDMIFKVQSLVNVALVLFSISAHKYVSSREVLILQALYLRR